MPIYHSTDIQVELLDDPQGLSLAELCRACQLSGEDVRLLVAEGVIEPLAEDLTEWRFHSLCISRVRRVQRLERDFGLNLAGAALVIELLDEIDHLKNQLSRLSMD